MIATFGCLNADFVFEVEASPMAGQTIAAKHFHIESAGKGASQVATAARDGAKVGLIGTIGCDAHDRDASGLGVDMSRVVTIKASALPAPEAARRPAYPPGKRLTKPFPPPDGHSEQTARED